MSSSKHKLQQDSLKEGKKYMKVLNDDFELLSPRKNSGSDLFLRVKHVSGVDVVRSLDEWKTLLDASFFDPILENDDNLNDSVYTCEISDFPYEFSAWTSILNGKFDMKNKSACFNIIEYLGVKSYTSIIDSIHSDSIVFKNLLTWLYEEDIEYIFRDYSEEMICNMCELALKVEEPHLQLRIQKLLVRHQRFWIYCGTKYTDDDFKENYIDFLDRYLHPKQVRVGVPVDLRYFLPSNVYNKDIIISGSYPYYMANKKEMPKKSDIDIYILNKNICALLALVDFLYENHRDLRIYSTDSVITLRGESLERDIQIIFTQFNSGIEVVLDFDLASAQWYIECGNMCYARATVAAVHAEKWKYVYVGDTFLRRVRIDKAIEKGYKLTNVDDSVINRKTKTLAEEMKTNLLDSQENIILFEDITLDNFRQLLKMKPFLTSMDYISKNHKCEYIFVPNIRIPFPPEGSEACFGRYPSTRIPVNISKENPAYEKLSDTNKIFNYTSNGKRWIQFNIKISTRTRIYKNGIRMLYEDLDFPLDDVTLTLLHSDHNAHFSGIAIDVVILEITPNPLRPTPKVEYYSSN